MSAEPEKVTQQGQSTGPPVTAALSVAEIPAPNPAEKQEGKLEGPSAEKAGPVESAERPAGADAGPTTNGGVEGAVPEPSAPQEEPKPATTDKPAEAAEPAALPTAPAATEPNQTNGAAKPVIAEPTGATESAAEPPKEASEKPVEPAVVKPTETEPAAAATAAGTNGEAKPAQDTEMKDAPAAAPETVTEDGVTSSNKRKAETALGPSADAEGDAAGSKRAKTDAEETSAPAKTDAEPPAAETNGGGAEAPHADAAAAPPAKKGGRPKKQAGKAATAAAAAAPVGRTARKTRSQGPVEV